MSEAITPQASATPDTSAASTPVADTSSPSSNIDTSSSEPSLESRIGSAIKSLEQPAEPADPEEIAVSDEPQADDVPSPVEQQSDDPLAAELGIDPKKYNRIPYHKVQKIIESKLQAQQEAFNAQMQETYGQYEQYIQQASEREQTVAAVEHLMQNQPMEYLKALARNPQYARLLAPILQGGQVQHTDPSMPQPDYDLGNGQFTYSQDGLARRMAWERQQAVQEAEARIMQQFQPILRREQEQAVINQSIETVRNQVSEAQSWPGFAENVDAINAALKADRKMSLEAAYRQVVFGKLTADRNKMRQELLDEINRQPRSTSVAPVAPVKRADEESSLDDNILKAIKGIK